MNKAINRPYFLVRNQSGQKRMRICMRFTENTKKTVSETLWKWRKCACSEALCPPPLPIHDIGIQKMIPWETIYMNDVFNACFGEKKNMSILRETSFEMVPFPFSFELTHILLRSANCTFCIYENQPADEMYSCLLERDPIFFKIITSAWDFCCVSLFVTH